MGDMNSRSNRTSDTDLAPGWYQVPTRQNTLCYWDGAEWTGQTAPVQPYAGPGVFQIAQGVALGVCAAGLVLRLLFGL